MCGIVGYIGTKKAKEIAAVQQLMSYLLNNCKNFDRILAEK